MHPEIILAISNAERSVSEATVAIERKVDEYVDGYTFVSDQGTHTPSPVDKVFIIDAIHGILADEEFLEELHRLIQNRRMISSLVH